MEKLKEEVIFVKNKKIKTKFMESAFLGFGLTFLLLGAYSCIFFVYFIVPKSLETVTIFSKLIMFFMLGVLPTLNWIFLIHRGFSIVEINENYIRKSLFRIFHKRTIYWDEIKEIRVINRVTNWIFFGKLDIRDISFNKLVAHKDVIRLELSENVLKVVRMYCNQEITGLDSINIH